MRVRFGELSSAERARLDIACRRADEAFRELSRGEAARAERAFAAVDPRLELRVRRDVSGRAEVAEVTAFEPAAWPLAQLLLEQARSTVGCALSLGRGAVPLELALEETRAKHGVELERSRVRAGFSRGHLLEITLAVPGGNGAENEQIAAEDLVRTLLGDRVFETWIGAVHVTAAPRGGPLRVLDVTAPRSDLAISELFDTVMAAVLGVQRGLPVDAYSSGGRAHDASMRSGQVTDTSETRADWTLLEVEPLSSTSRVRKDDLLLASTCTPELLRCYLDGSPCASQRFTRGGERFVFVSYADDASSSMQSRVARRGEIEQALADTLQGEGAVTGVGIGVQTSYVDLALCNLETGLPRIVAKLRGLATPPHAFVQFCDSEFAEEWLSVREDTFLTTSDLPHA